MDGFSEDEGDKMKDIPEDDEEEDDDDKPSSRGGKLKISRKKKKRTLKGGTGKYNYTIDQVLSVWHFFDKFHDFRKYLLFTKDDEKKEIKEILRINYEDMLKLYDNDCEAENFHILIKHLRAKSYTPLSSLMLYYRIHSIASNKTNALVKYSIPSDETSAVNDLNIDNTPTYLRDLLRSKTNSEGTQQGTQDITMIYDTNLNLSIPSLSSSGTSDQHIWTSFKKDILEQIGTQKNPFAKIWDPHGQSEPDTDVNPCVGTDDEKQQKKKLIDRVYNTSDIDNKENYNAFRKLTQDHFKIESACSNDKYIGIRIIFKKIVLNNALQINDEYKNVISFITNNGIKEFKFEVYKNNMSVIIKSNGFSKEIIANTIKTMYANPHLHDFFKDEDKYKKFCKIDTSTSTESYNVKLLALLLITHVYIKYSNKDDLKLVLFDFKKSGDWGQVLYCKHLEPKGCFISMDRYSALYGIMHDVPTIFLSTMLYHDPEKNKRDYCEIGIYITDRKIDMVYIRRLLCDYARSVLFTKFMNIKGIGINKHGHDCILNVFVKQLLNEINNLIPQTNSTNILKELLSKDYNGKNILERIFNIYLENIIKIFTVVLKQFSITSNFIDEYYVIKRIKLDAFLSQISDDMNLGDETSTSIYNNFFEKIKKHFYNQLNALFSDTPILKRKRSKSKSASSSSSMSAGYPRSTSPLFSLSPSQQGPASPSQQGPASPSQQGQLPPSPALSDAETLPATSPQLQQNISIDDDSKLINLINNFKKIVDDLFDIFYIIYYYFICDDENNINIFLHHYVRNVFSLFFDTSCTIRAKLNTSSRPSTSTRSSVIPPARSSVRRRRQTGEETVDVNPVQESLRNSCKTSISHLRSSAESAINTVPSGDKIADLKTKYNKLLQIYEIFLNDFNTSVSRLHFELFHKIGFMYKNSQSEQSSIIHSFYTNLCIQIKTILDNKIDDFFITKSESTNNEFHIHVQNFITENLESARHEEEDISIDTISFNNINDFLLTELQQIHDKIKQDFENEKGPILIELIDKEFLDKKAKTMNEVINNIDTMYNIYKDTDGIPTVGGVGKRSREYEDDNSQENQEYPTDKRNKMNHNESKKRGTKSLNDIEKTKKPKTLTEGKTQGQSVSRKKTSKKDPRFQMQLEEQKKKKAKLNRIKKIWNNIEQHIMLFENNRKIFTKITELYFFITDNYTRTDNGGIPELSDSIKTEYKNMLTKWEKTERSNISTDIINNKLSFERVFNKDKYDYMTGQIIGISNMIKDSIKGIK